MRKAFFPAVALAAVIVSCSSPHAYYLEGSGQEQKRMEALFNLLDSGNLSIDERFAVTHKISSFFMDQNQLGRLVSFLADEVAGNPDGPYNARHLLSIAYAYALQGADSIAVLYFDRIVKNYADLEIGGESIHYVCLRRLLTLVADPGRRIDYRRELISRFPDRVDMGAELFLLGTEYEATGEWESAIDAYRRFLPYFDSEIPGYPDATQYARSFIDLATTKKDWAFDTLDELLGLVRKAFDAGDSRSLSRLRAKVGFFAMSWNQDRDDGNSQVQFDLGAFMPGRVRYADKLDPSSNAREAFLRTTGWTERLPTWYLYFRKIDFPADPEVHGRWEWAGIYFGEKLQ
ncbi:MAG TPA: tetratricopeptide repeat protein [Spirochaetales bacterium]|nr:tetratricopeptide repeat protein [Spirochaetales bacterium]